MNSHKEDLSHSFYPDLGHTLDRTVMVRLVSKEKFEGVADLPQKSGGDHSKNQTEARFLDLAFISCDVRLGIFILLEGWTATCWMAAEICLLSFPRKGIML